jgi:gliding motility-associated-like protein
MTKLPNFRTYVLVFILMTFATTFAKATHIVGGEVTYQCLGNNRYLIKMAIYRDCISGAVGAIADDNPAFISLFNQAGVRITDDIVYAKISGGTVVPTDFDLNCYVNPPRTCLNRIEFEKIYQLGSSPVGYKILYQNCCRNASIVNIIDPSSAGATYFCTIPPNAAAECNNSATFNKIPPQIICVNNPLNYNHSAQDIDGDSLSYEFCETYTAPREEVKSYPVFFADNILYRNPYTFRNPMGGNPRIKIDSKTGIISGTPNLQGRFVVAVCCHEWRRGIKINTVTREFQFVVTNCSKGVIANIPQYSEDFNTFRVNCKDYTIPFENTSVGGSTYFWDFGVPGVTNDTSIAFAPTYTYPDSGTYLVRLYVNRGTNCVDSFNRFVKIYPKLIAQFNAPENVCPGDTVDFKNLSTSTYEINKWIWNFDDATPLDFNQDTKHSFALGGLYNVGMIAINTQGCLDTVFKKILVDPFVPSVGNDTTIVINERINFQGTDNGIYSWSPSKYLSNPNINDPTGTFTDTGTFKYIIKVKTDNGCIGYDTINIRVIGNPALAVPNIFTPNGDGKNDRFRPILVGYQSLRYFRIYNRYGQEMFKTENINDSWDGTFNGQAQEVGVYYWMLGVKDRFGNNSDAKGDITLAR